MSRTITINGVEHKSVSAAARALGVDPGLASSRLSMGWEPERAFSKEYHNSKPVVVAGVEYPSIATAAKAIGITDSKARHLVEKNLPLDFQTQHRGVTIDGVPYRTTKAACKAFGVPAHVYQQRRADGMGLEEAITTPHEPVRVVVNGAGYPSIAAAARGCGSAVSAGQAAARIAAGMTPEDAFTMPPKNRHEVVVFGVAYPSVSAAAKAHGISYGAVQTRLGSGWDLERALTTPAGGTFKITIGGKEYACAADACREHGVGYGRYIGRIRCGWTPEQALGLEARYEGERCLGMVYLVTQISTGKNYVGQTMRGAVNLRWEQHVADAAKGGRTLLQRAIRKAGVEDFTVVELSRHDTRDALNAAEAAAIVEHDALAPAGFNQTTGGSGWVGATGKSITWKGKKYRSVAAIARAEGVPMALVQPRLNRGWTLKRAITTPKATVNAASRPVTVEGVRYESRSHACRAYGVSRNVALFRLQKGWSLKRALTTPVANNGGKAYVVEGVEYGSMTALGAAYGVGQKVLWHRLKKLNLTPEQAVGIEPWPEGIRKPARKAG